MGEVRGGLGWWKWEWALRNCLHQVVLELHTTVAHSHSHSQIKWGAPTAMDWATGSLTAQNWLPSKTARQRALDARITSQPQQPTTSTAPTP